MISESGTLSVPFLHILSPPLWIYSASMLAARHPVFQANARAFLNTTPPKGAQCGWANGPNTAQSVDNRPQNKSTAGGKERAKNGTNKVPDSLITPARYVLLNAACRGD